MSNLLGALSLAGAASVAGGYEISSSLRFNSADSAHLNRTPASASNRKTFTISFWAKRGSSWSDHYVFEGYTNDTSRSFIRFGSDKFYFAYDGSTNNLITTQVFRDSSAWYHFVLAVDTTQVTNTNRLKLYVNGLQVTAFDTASYPTQNTDYFINNNIAHSLGRSGYSGGYGYFNGYLTEIHFIDGQALDETDFGEFNSTTGVWGPIAYTGTYGTNGFYLPIRVGSSGWSGQFDGSGDYLSLPANSGFHFGSSDFTIEQFINIPTSSQTIAWHDNSVSFGSRIITGSITLTTNTWHHVACTKQGTTLRLYVDGVLDTSGTVLAEVYNNNDPLFIGKGADHTTGSGRDMLHCGELGGGNNKWFFYTTGNGTGDFQGYMSNLRILKGTALYTGSTYTVPTSPLTSITNTQVLTLQDSTFIDNSPNALTVTVTGNTKTQNFAPFVLADVIDDYSGNNNNWQPTNLDLTTTGSGADILVDVPTNYGTDTGIGGEVRGNYCTWNPLTDVSSLVVSDGNLTVTSSADNWPIVTGTMGLTSGKHYYEISTTDQTRWGAGWSTKEFVNGSTFADSIANAYLAYSTDPLAKYELGVFTNPINGSPAFTTSDILQIAIDVDAGKIWYGIDNVWVNDNSGNAGNPATGSNPVSTFTAGTQMFPAVVANQANITANFGQRAFAYTAPSGFKALVTTNLPNPTVIEGDEYFNTVLYTGDGTGDKAITGVGFQPDWVWVKSRSDASSHRLSDVVRGSNGALFSNLTNAETVNAASGYINSFDSDGFSTVAGATNNSNYNNTSISYVAWNWKANGAGVANTQGSIASTVSASTDAGFSIVTYTGVAANNTNFTVGHGLGVKPAMIIIKNRGLASSSKGWPVFHQAISTGGVFLDSTDLSEAQNFNFFWGAQPNSTTFTIRSDSTVSEANRFRTNGRTDGYVAYCFAEIPGYSAFGSYTGNASTDGPFVFLGFRPAWVMIKRTDSANSWVMLDTARDTFNITEKNLYAESSGAEAIYTAEKLDILSNGFKQKQTGVSMNASGGTYIYMAFAESPFKFALAR